MGDRTMRSLAAELIALHSDAEGCVARDVLRAKYADMIEVQQPSVKGPALVTTLRRGGGQRARRARARAQANRNAYKGARVLSEAQVLRGPSSRGRTTSKYLSEDLRRLERVGAIERVGADLVRVVDWEALREAMRGDGG